MIQLNLFEYFKAVQKENDIVHTWFTESKAAYFLSRRERSNPLFLLFFVTELQDRSDVERLNKHTQKQQQQSSYHIIWCIKHHNSSIMYKKIAYLFILYSFIIEMDLRCWRRRPRPCWHSPCWSPPWPGCRPGSPCPPRPAPQAPPRPSPPWPPAPAPAHIITTHHGLER